MEILRPGIQLKNPEIAPGTLDLQVVESALTESGLSICRVNKLGKNKTALTNNVFSATLIDSEGRKIVAILKISEGKKESREIVWVNNETSVGGWMVDRLQNEFNLLSMIYQAGIRAPRPILYRKLAKGDEILVESRLVGRQGSELRYPNVGIDEFREMEKERGRILARINNVNCPNKAFGTLDDEATHFDSWPKYFKTKVSTTLSLLHGMYPVLSRLKRFGRLVSNETEWRVLIERTAQLYSGNGIQRLLEEDNVPTVSHADYWDGNTISRMTSKKGWEIAVIDFDRGGIEGKSFDLALWLSWKVPAKKAVNPIFAVPDFLEGYRQAGGIISPRIRQYVVIYGLWQYLDFLIIDTIYGIDRTNKSVPEIRHLFNQMEKIGIK